jgi:hypothetical protein
MMTYYLSLFFYYSLDVLCISKRYYSGLSHVEEMKYWSRKLATQQAQRASFLAKLYKGVCVTLVNTIKPSC